MMAVIAFLDDLNDCMRGQYVVGFSDFLCETEGLGTSSRT